LPGDEAEDLDGLIRRVDPDRWLTSRFIADPAARADVMALYAFDHELARARAVASNPLMAEIRLTWWREALDEIFAAGPPRRHPVAQSLASAVQRHGLPREPLESMVDGQIQALDMPAFDATAAGRWAEAVESSVARLAAMILDPAARAGAAAPAGHAWGLALLKRGRLAAPETIAPLLGHVLAEARPAALTLGVAALPAALPARLARFDLAGRTPGPLRKQASLIVAVATGRI